MRHTARTVINSVKPMLPSGLRRQLGSRYRSLRRRFRHLPEDHFIEGLSQPIRSHVFLYESFYGASVNCSPRAIFEALLEHPAHTKLEHVWSLADPDQAPKWMKDHPRVRVVQRNSPEYAGLLATAGSVISNSTLATWYVRREGQIYANTWHGVPLKQMFKHESAANPTVHRNSQRNFLQATHILLQNSFTADRLLGSSDVREATASRTFSTGAPRVDATLNSKRDALRKELGVPAGRRIVFVAPTWRGFLGQTVKSVPMLDALMAELELLPETEFAVFAQLHNFVGSEVSGIRAIPKGMSTNRFMAAVDVLVTDYSSIMFDFFPTGRAVVLFVYDRHEYEEIRGLYAELEDLPAQICYRPREVVEAIRTGSRSVDMPQFRAASRRFFPLEDGAATERALEALFDAPEVVSPQPAPRPRVLFFGGGWKNNGITTSMLNLLIGLSAFDLDVYVATDGLGIEGSAEQLANMSRVPESVHLIHRAGAILSNLRESRALERFYRRNRFADDAHKGAVRALMQRESRRMFGDLEFDAAIDFSGYARYWSLVIGNTSAKRRAIYQHNDLRSEADLRFDVLNGVFASYSLYDRIATVSEETRQVNLRSLGQYYPSPEASVTVANMIAPDQIRARAAERPKRGLALPKGDGPLFVMAGRLSPEKAVDRAIRAVAQLRDEGEAVRLIVMGTGPLEDELAALIQSLNLGGRVRLAGHVDNPFPIVAMGDCFLLSSNYEGQPMVLLEALTLAKPVIATDIPGARAVLGTDYGHLVSPDVAGVADGMRRFLRGEVRDASAFDAEAYCEAALQDFFDKVLGFTPSRRSPAS